MVRTGHFSLGQGLGSSPGWETEILQAMQLLQKRNKIEQHWVLLVICIRVEYCYSLITFELMVPHYPSLRFIVFNPVFD